MSQPTSLIPERFRLSARGFVLAACLALFHLGLSHRPLWHTDLWGHLAYGRLIVAEHALPRSEPLMPLSRGMAFVDLAWLSEVGGFLAFRWNGIAAIQFLYATAITGCFGLLAYRTLRRTDSLLCCLLALGVFLWVDWQSLLIVRPQLAGLLCFLTLFTELTRRGMGNLRLTPLHVAGVLLLFAAWANLHGSFVVGLGLLIVFAAGRPIDVALRSGKLLSACADRRTRHATLLLAAALVGALINPYGWRAIAEAISISRNPNLADLVEWWPLDIRMRQGQAATAVALALVVLYRLTPRRISAIEVLLLIGLGGAALWASRMIAWFGPVAGYFIAIHAAAVANRFRVPGAPGWLSARSTGWTIAGLGFAGLCAASTPLGAALIRGSRVPGTESLSAETPIGATEFIRNHPPRGQIFNAYEWGDYLLWAGPPELKVFVASHAHLVPPDVWQHYLRIINAGSGFQDLLRQYGVRTAILDPERHAELVQVLIENDAWSIAYQDDRSVILKRRADHF